MTEIKVLDKSIFNRIAAGEVVEKPSSIVKELIENSIDAGATNISITIKGGGIDFIRVSDNGRGIKEESVKTAFLPHATSKISSVSDLDTISTLGFRGEALPSIASVAKVSMITRPKNQTMAIRYVVDNGVEVDFGPMGATEGTVVTVENLFERIPARKKFLAKPSSEENSITSLIAKFILANPSISFDYYCADKQIYKSNGTGLEDAIKCVYGVEYLSKMVKIDANISDIVLCGYVNTPSFSKHSRSFQTLIVNGRFVENSEVSYAVYGCYQKYLMSRQYPTYILHLTVPYDMVDVNVHPNKMEVKFAIPSLVKKVITDAIKTNILESLSAPKSIESQFDSDFFTVCDDFEVKTTPKSDAPFDIDVKPTVAYSEISTTNAYQTDDEPQVSVFSPDDYISQPKKFDSSVLDIPRTVVIQSRATKSTSFSDSGAELQTKNDISSEQIGFNIKPERKIVGKIFNTYILIEQGDDLMLIDQHAAHEKILYDRLVKEYENGAIPTQTMLVPYEFTLSPSESDIVLENIDTLRTCGFNIKHKGNTSFQLKTVPLCCIGINAQSFISDFLKLENATVLIPELFREKLMQTACKSAIKGKDDLDKSEIDALLDAFENEVSEFFCPHGRPIVIKITQREIEKWFKRIV